MRVALVHDYLSQDGGAERVLRTLHEIWPEAPIFVLFHDREKIDFPRLAEIRESFLARLPFCREAFHWYLPWMPVATERHNLSNFDVVISSSSIFAKGIITPPGTLHISYCHTPARFLWADGHEYLSDLKHSLPIKLILSGLIHRLRLWDQMSTSRVDRLIANSHTVRSRILKYYRRESDVINPPVDTKMFFPSEKISDYFVAGGRLVPYKRLDLAIKVFNRLKIPLKIFGIGPELPYLQKIAKPNIKFLGKISESEKSNLFARAQAFVHPQLEDFGITPIESMAAGRPVIAYGQGGATETIIHGETGLLFPRQTWESLYQTITDFKPERWDAEKLRTQADKFNTEIFKQKISQYVADVYDEFKKGFNQCELKLGK